MSTMTNSNGTENRTGDVVFRERAERIATGSVTDYEITNVDIDSAARHNVTVKLNGQVGATLTTTPSYVRDKPQTFQPVQLYMTWRWDFDMGVWELLAMSVQGWRLNKDGSRHKGMLQSHIRYITRAETQSDTPSQFLALVEAYQPTWKVVPMETQA